MSDEEQTQERERRLVGIEAGRQGEMLGVRFLFRTMLEVTPWSPGFAIQPGSTTGQAAHFLRGLAAYIDPNHAPREATRFLETLEGNQWEMDDAMVHLLIETIRGGPETPVATEGSN